MQILSSTRYGWDVIWYQIKITRSRRELWRANKSYEYSVKTWNWHQLARLRIKSINWQKLLELSDEDPTFGCSWSQIGDESHKMVRRIRIWWTNLSLDGFWCDPELGVWYSSLPVLGQETSFRTCVVKLSVFKDHLECCRVDTHLTFFLSFFFCSSTRTSYSASDTEVFFFSFKKII